MHFRLVKLSFDLRLSQVMLLQSIHTQARGLWPKLALSFITIDTHCSHRVHVKIHGTKVLSIICIQPLKLPH